MWRRNPSRISVCFSTRKTGCATWHRMRNPEFASNSVPFSSKENGSAQSSDRFCVAEHDDCSPILDCLKSTGVDFRQKDVKSNIAFDVPHLSANHTPVVDRFCAKDVAHPGFWGKWGSELVHAPPCALFGQQRVNRCAQRARRRPRGPIRAYSLPDPARPDPPGPQHAPPARPQSAGATERSFRANGP